MNGFFTFMKYIGGIFVSASVDVFGITHNGYCLLRLVATKDADFTQVKVLSFGWINEAKVACFHPNPGTIGTRNGDKLVTLSLIHI